MKCVILILCALSSVVRADCVPAEEWYKEILERRFRPSLAEVVVALERCPQYGPLVRGPQSHPISSELLTNLAELIAQLESIHPNGLYAVLGRDAYGIADALEAYYLSVGHNGRVVRLGASSQTFVELGAKPDRAFEFLVSNGLDMQKALSGERPFIIIDHTTFSDTSQSRVLLSSVYNRPGLSELV